MSKIEKQTISTKLTKYQIISRHRQATNENRGGKKSVMEHDKPTLSVTLCTLHQVLHVHIYAMIPSQV